MFDSLCVKVVVTIKFTRSIEYDEMTKQCSLSEEDSISQKDEIGMASSPTHHFYDFVCLDSRESTIEHITVIGGYVILAFFTYTQLVQNWLYRCSNLDNLKNYKVRLKGKIIVHFMRNFLLVAFG